MLRVSFRAKGTARVVFLRPFSSSSSSTSSTSYKVIDENLRSFLHKNGGQFTKRVRIGVSGYGGQNLIANEMILPGQTIISVPENLTFSSYALSDPDNPNRPLAAKNFRWDEERDRTDWIKDRTKRALVLMSEYHLGQNSKFYPWLQTVPAPSLSSPIGDQNLPFIGGATLPLKYWKELRGTTAFMDLSNLKLENDRAWIYANRLITLLPPSVDRTPFVKEHFDYFMALAGNRLRPSVGPLLDVVQPARLPVRVNCTTARFEYEANGKSKFMTCLLAAQPIMVGDELFVESPDSPLSLIQVGKGIPFDQQHEMWIMADREISRMLEGAVDVVSVPDVLQPDLDEKQEPSRGFYSLKYSSDYEESVTQNETWAWFSATAGFDTEKLRGKYFPLKFGTIFPSMALFDFCSRCQQKREGFDNSTGLSEAAQEVAMQQFGRMIENRLASLPYKLQDDLKWLDDFRKKEGGNILSDAPENQGKSSKSQSKEELDYIMRDVVYARSVEKALLQLHVKEMSSMKESGGLQSIYAQLLERHKYTKFWLREEWYDIPNHIIPPDEVNPFLDPDESAEDVSESLKAQFSKNQPKLENEASIAQDLARKAQHVQQQQQQKAGKEQTNEDQAERMIEAEVSEEQIKTAEQEAERAERAALQAQKDEKERKIKEKAKKEAEKEAEKETDRIQKEEEAKFRSKLANSKKVRKSPPTHEEEMARMMEMSGENIEQLLKDQEKSSEK